MTDYPHIRIETPAAVATRTYEGGGGGTYPRSDYARHAAKVFAEAQTAVALMDASVDAGRAARRYFRVALPPDKTAWSSVGATTANDLHGTIVGAASKNVVHLSTTPSGASLMLAELARYAAPSGIGKSKFATVEEIGLIPTAEKIGIRAQATLRDPDQVVTVLAQMFVDLRAVERAAIASVLGEWLSARRGVLESTFGVESGVYLRIRARARDIREAASNFLSLQSIDPVDHVLELSSTPHAQVDPRVRVQAQAGSAVVAMFDGGVMRGSRLIDGSIVDREEPIGPPYSCDHGTFVASRIIYGDTLRDQLAAGALVPSTRVLSVCTISHDGIGNRRSATTDELMRIVRDTVVRWHPQIRVYNLSQNLFPRDPAQDATVPDDVVSPLAAELDVLSRRYRVLFVLTAGNYPRPGIAPPPAHGPYPMYFEASDARIVPPAESVLGLTVGSVTTIGSNGSLAPADAPSPFTRRGPGFSGFQKPDLVAHGGNYGLLWQTTFDLAAVGIGDHGDQVAFGNGTSFAAPLVARYAAQLFDLLPGATPELVRALLLHFAAPVSGGTSAVAPELLTGHGHATGERMLRSLAWSQAFVHAATLPYREIRRVPFFVPTALLAPRRRERVRVRVTCVWSPETNRALKASYCMSHLRCKLVKRDGGGELREVAADDRSTHRYASVSRLEKVFSTQVSSGQWELIVEHESRWKPADPVAFAVVITVEDPVGEAGSIDVAAAIRAEAPAHLQAALVQPLRVRP